MGKEFESDHFHDVIVEILGTKNIDNKELLTEDNLQKFYNMLPQHIIDDAKSYGCADTVFRDNAYTWLLENWDAVLKVVLIKNTICIGMTITTYIKVEMPIKSNPEEILHMISDNVDYDFTYNSDGVRIIDSEIMEVSLH